MNKIKLGDVMDVKRGTSLSGDYYSTSGDLVRLTLGNFKYPDCGFKPNTAKDDIYFVGEVKPEYIMKKGDIITPLTEQVKGLLGNTATIPESDKYIQSGDIGKIIPDESMINKRFSYYLVSSPTVKKQLSAASQQTKIRHTSPDKIKDCIAFIPDLYQQKKIAHLLDTINLLIQTNDSAIKQLESMAKTIYDYWFLQFEFPNEEGKPYKSSGGKMVWNEELKREIPEGWGVTNVGNITTCLDSKRVPLSSKDRESMKGPYPYYGATSEMDSVNEYLFDGDYVLLAEDGSVMDDNGFPILQRTSGKVWVNNHAHVLQPKKPYGCKLLMFILKNIPVSMIKTGSIQMKVNQENLNAFKVLSIPENLIEKANSILNPIDAKIIMLKQENRELASLRDFLLPMLMNGQVTFKEDE